MAGTVRIENVELKGLKEYLSSLAGKNAPVEMRVGIFEDATNDVNGMHVAEYAAYNEYGTMHIPSRPFLRKTFKEKSKSWASIILGGLKANIDNPEKAFHDALSGAGRMAESDVVNTIKSDLPPTDTAWQIYKRKKKGEERTTLIDTATMVNSVGYRLFTQSGEPMA